MTNNKNYLSVKNKRMKTKIANFFCMSFIWSVIMLTSCNNNNIKETYWSGSVYPGVYKGHINWESMKNTISSDDYEITLNDNLTFEMKWHHTYSYNYGPFKDCGIEVFYGTVKRRTEMYNNELKVWYDLEGSTLSHSTATSMTITEDGRCHFSCYETYQAIIDSQHGDPFMLTEVK